NSFKVTPIKDVVTEFKTPDSLQTAASRGTNHGGLLSSNFAFKGVNVSSRRMAHTDVKFPDFSNYRREVTLDTQKAARDTEDQRRSLSHAVFYGGMSSTNVFQSKKRHNALFKLAAMAADQRALASIEVNLDEIPEGVTKTYEWRGKPVFVKHRTKAEIARCGLA
ncbi:Ubiquinol cytochrome reductase transmembrane region, partial [Teladorsagia circumcincta]